MPDGVEPTRINGAAPRELADVVAVRIEDVVEEVSASAGNLSADVDLDANGLEILLNDQGAGQRRELSLA